VDDPWLRQNPGISVLMADQRQNFDEIRIALSVVLALYCEQCFCAVIITVSGTGLFNKPLAVSLVIIPRLLFDE